VVDACEKRPDYILRQSGFWLDDCRLDRGADVGNGRTERAADKFYSLDSVSSQKNQICLEKPYCDPPEGPGRPSTNGFIIIDILKRGRYKYAIYKHNGTPLTALPNGELCLTEQL